MQATNNNARLWANKMEDPTFSVLPMSQLDKAVALGLGKYFFFATAEP